MYIDSYDQIISERGIMYVDQYLDINFKFSTLTDHLCQ